MAEQYENAQQAPQSAPPRRRLRKPQWLTLGAAGFTLSVSLAVINAFYAVRGAEVAVQPIEQLLLFRDGQGDKAVLTLALRLAMINASATHGDVLMKARLSFAGSAAAAFPYSSEVKPVFSAEDTSTIKCDTGSRCIALPGLLAIEQGDQILDIPGGAVRSPYLAFPVSASNCAGQDCARFGNFDSVVIALAGKPLEIRVDLDFFSDGARRLRCLARPIDLQYLQKIGWMSMRCTTSTVGGASWF